MAAKTNGNTHSQKNSDQTIMAIGVLGAVVGGAIGSALAVALSDKDTRKRVFDTVDTIRDYAMETAEQMRERYPELKAKTRKVVNESEKVADKFLLEKGKDNK